MRLVLSERDKENIVGVGAIGITVIYGLALIGSTGLVSYLLAQTIGDFAAGAGCVLMILAGLFGAGVLLSWFIEYDQRASPDKSPK